MSFAINQALLTRTATRLASQQNIFWIIGGAATGKSTICRAIAAQRNWRLYDMDAHIYGGYMGRYSWEDHPASQTWFTAVNPLAWILSLSSTEFDNLNRATNVEYLDLFAEDWQQNPNREPLLVDGRPTRPIRPHRN